MAGRNHSGVTISEVAAAAGVSRQTVSNVLNAPSRVAPETAARVRKAIDELGYRPNRAAQNLRERASRCIGFEILPPTGMNNLLDRFLHALSEAACPAGYHVLVFTHTAKGERLAAYQELVGTGTVDGFVLADVGLNDPRVAWFAERRIPFVSFGRPWVGERLPFSWVDVDGAYGVEQGVDHLVSRGHRRIGYLGWPAGSRVGDDRRNGWLRAMRRHWLAADGLNGECEEDAGAISEVARHLLSRPDPPTAFVCGSDTYAVAARIAGGVDQSGCPSVEVIGFDDSPAAALMLPPLSSVRQPLAEVARRIVALLVERLQGAGTPLDGVLLRPELVARDECCPVPEGEGSRRRE